MGGAIDCRFSRSNCSRALVSRASPSYSKGAGHETSHACFELESTKQPAFVHGDDRIVDKVVAGVGRKRHWLLLLSMLGADSIDNGLFEMLLGTRSLEPFMADAIVARP